VSQQQLDLLKLPARRPAQLRAGAASVVRCDPRNAGSFCVPPEKLPHNLFTHTLTANLVAAIYRARQGSKTARVLGLLKRSGGAPLKQLTTATGWQSHSVRGFRSGALGKKMGLRVTSTKAEGGERRYSVKA
jgi:hypothetical protein